MKSSCLLLLTLLAGAHGALAASAPPALDNPRAIEPARRLHAWLHELSSSDAKANKLISGHWLGASFKPDNAYPFNLQEPLEIRRHTGKWIGMVDGWICPGEYGAPGERDALADCMWYDRMIAEYELWWSNGGIVHVDASFFAPLKDRYAERLEKGLKVDLEAILTPDTPEHRRWRALLDRMAEFFHALEAKGIPVIFRPFTEAYIAHFWYSRQNLGNEGSKRLWVDLHRHLTEVRGCNNIIWDFQGGRSWPHYPGDAYVDLYTTKSEYRAWKVESFQTLEDGDVPMGNAELGDYGASTRADEKGKSRIPWRGWLEAIKPRAPRLCFYTIWHKNWGPVKQAGADGRFSDYDSGYDEMIADDYVLTRDELPAFIPRPARVPGWGESRAIRAGGEWDVQGANLVRRDARGEGKVLFGSTDWTDYSIAARVPVAAGGECGILGRCASTDIFYLLTLDANGLKLIRRFNGKNTTLGSWSHGLPAGRSCLVKLTMRGNHLEGAIDVGDGLVRRIEVQDDFIPCGCVGFRASDNGAAFSEIAVAADGNRG